MLGDLIQLCNKRTTSTKEGRETWAGKIAQTESMNTVTGGQNCANREHEYSHRPNIVKTCFTCRRYTVKSHAWENQQHACYYGGTPMRHRKTACFEALVLEPHFAQSCARFLLLYCNLGWQSSLQASFHWKMQNVKLPVCPTPAGCICSNSGAIFSAGQ